MSQDDFYRGDPPPYGAPTPGAAPHGAPPYGTPSYGPPGYGPPGHGAPFHGPPGHGAPFHGPPGHGAPFHGPPGHGAPSFGPPGHGPLGYGSGWRRPTNQLAIIALITTFVFAPVGLVLGLVARGQVRRSGEQGDGLALAAVIVGGLGTTLMAAGLLAWIGLLASISDGAFAP